jgi:uncharacterized protein YxeA
MKNYFKVIISLALFVAFSFSVNAQNVITQNQSKFVSEFVAAVNVQKKRKVYKMVSKDYKANFKGSKEELLLNLFAGRIKKSREYSRVSFDKISNIRLIEVNEVQEGMTRYHFILMTPEGLVEVRLLLTDPGNKGKFGFQPERS